MTQPCWLLHWTRQHQSEPDNSGAIYALVMNDLVSLVIIAYSGLRIEGWGVQAILSQEDQIISNRRNLKLHHQRRTGRHHLDVQGIFIGNIPKTRFDYSKYKEALHCCFLRL